MAILYLWPDQVRQLQENASQLRAIYAGEKSDAILVREQEVMRAWKELLVACEGSRVQVTTVTDKIQFFAIVRELSMWTDGIMGQIGPFEDARYELLQSHVFIISEILFTFYMTNRYEALTSIVLSSSWLNACICREMNKLAEFVFLFHYGLCVHMCVHVCVF